jgi:hypothetical protein
MTRAIVVVAAVVAARVAAAAPVDVPAGWTERDATQLAQQFASMRGAREIAVHLYRSPADAQLITITWVSPDLGKTRAAITQYDEGIENGVRAGASTHVATSRELVGGQLVVDQTDLKGDMRFRQIRRHGLDADGAVHSLMVSCAGPASSISSCDAILAGAHLDVARPAPFADDDTSELGENLGFLAGCAVILALLVYAYVHARRTRRA